MLRCRLASVFALVACAGSPRPIPDDAVAAYRAKDYVRCAELFAARATRATGRARGEAFYQAASCHARAGHTQLAFAALEDAIHASFATDKLQQDPDLESLHADPRWSQAADEMDTMLDAPVEDRALQRELLDLVEADQAARKAWLTDFNDPALTAAVRAIDARATARMKEILAQRGWPGKKRVGTVGAHAAWLLVQHADADPAFQALCLAKMSPLVESREVSAIDYAYLYDRVALADGRKQRFGTQFTGDEPKPIEDEANVDARRKAIGLGTLAEYREEIRRIYGTNK